MLNKKIIKKEIKVFHFLLLFTSKVLIGIGIGLMLANIYWFTQPYWFMAILAGIAILIPTLAFLMRVEIKEEKKLKKKIK